MAKPYLEELTQSKETIILSFDDSIQEKKYTEKNHFAMKTPIYLAVQQAAFKELEKLSNLKTLFGCLYA